MTDNHDHLNQMTNSHILAGAFAYHEPSSLDEAISLLGKYGKGGRLMAGGTNILTNMKMEKDAPQAIISVNKISGLDAIEKTPEGGLRIGAAVTIHAARHHAEVKANYPALSEACALFGSTQIQILGTIGGNVCNGSPASDTVPVLLAYDAEVLLKGSKDERKLPLAEFLIGPGKTALKDDEILQAVLLPPPPTGSTSVFVKVSRVAADLAKASLAVVIAKDREAISECRLAFGSVAPTVMRVKKAEALLNGKKFSQNLLSEAGEAASKEISPIDDIRSTAWYRRQIAKVMVIDALNLAWERLAGGHKQADRGKSLPTQSTGAAARPHNLNADDVQEVVLKINGKEQAVRVKSNDLLLNVLREKLFLTGAKYGCGLGECGACTILMDGRAVLACLVLAVAAEGHEIVTAEGLQAADGRLDPIQSAYVDETGFQCGFCTPGFVLATKALLNEIPHPTEDEIRGYLKGNRCRCTGYASIVRSVIRSVQPVNE